MAHRAQESHSLTRSAVGHQRLRSGTAGGPSPRLAGICRPLCAGGGLGGGKGGEREFSASSWLSLFPLLPPFPPLKGKTGFLTISCIISLWACHSPVAGSFSCPGRRGLSPESYVCPAPSLILPSRALCPPPPSLSAGCLIRSCALCPLQPGSAAHLVAIEWNAPEQEAGKSSHRD